MSQTTLLLEEFSLLTPAFKGGSQVPETTTQGQVVRFVLRGKLQHGPGKTIDALIDELTAEDPILTSDLQAARGRRADRIVAEGQKSLKTLRLSRGLSQADLAAAVGMQQPHIARIERGNNCPTLQTCRKLASALNVDMNTLNEHMPVVADSIEGIA